ncbi:MULTISPECIES: hypothetical protein [unclassified Mesorhizobium]|uniref:hypothetical protein n=1 Tax=unclassified Mesorhizobium TaxID=325217 RepID=UPI00109347F4|nr:MULTISPECIES: hypothetical protein [unclassified Mesorhizobium]TGT90906.1 hypothetical protein EN804_06110 [Mesorhizobium sp. M8A.F.Ca.ET.161.01.1.1]TGV43814.1 hypothetical protein EN785_07435 [Mesorhizobium sp. M8A.F.Ca.ET.142.01.1.1]
MTWLAVVAFLRKWVLPVLTFGITLPVWVFLVAGAWLYFDKSSAVRTAVDRAVTKLVAGAEIEALNAKLDSERRIREWSDSAAAQASQIAETERRSRFDLEAKLTISEIDRKNQADELAQIEAQPVAADCRVDQRLLERLRNR